ncbi:MAG: FkbM family methyltransferase [Methanoculleus marisnigri]|nr:FkbM family methyltransferase [Methanoculleus marisnigri]
MTFISYAQNFEDVMLWRALQHIENGFYIDVGAWSPDIDSVTRAFYERGWRGINVEPNPDAHTQLLTRRTRDINLRTAIGDTHGIQTMSIVVDTGLSTLDETIAQEHASAGWKVEKQEVKVTTLAALWERYVPEGQEVHILKVDVEGLEEAVLQGNNWSKYRPWIVVVEATLPQSQQESHEAWEPLLLNANYHFTYADGLNRFYVANEHAELLTAFKYPPNIFDDFKLNVQQQAESRAQQATATFDELNSKAQHWRTIAGNLSHELHAMQTSHCWRITRPLRDAYDVFLRIRARPTGILQIIKHGIRRMLGPILAYLIRFTLAHPGFKDWMLTLLRRSPALEARLYKFVIGSGIITGGAIVQTPFDTPDRSTAGLSTLTLSARRTYTELKAAIEQNNRDY